VEAFLLWEPKEEKRKVKVFINTSDKMALRS
jgi:hypothetical protein